MMLLYEWKTLGTSKAELYKYVVLLLLKILWCEKWVPILYFTRFDPKYLFWGSVSSSVKLSQILMALRYPSHNHVALWKKEGPWNHIHHGRIKRRHVVFYERNSWDIRCNWAFIKRLLLDSVGNGLTTSIFLKLRWNKHHF